MLASLSSVQLSVTRTNKAIQHQDLRYCDGLYQPLPKDQSIEAIISNPCTGKTLDSHIVYEVLV